jgi:putative membrane protein
VTALGQAHPELESDPTYQELVRVTGEASGYANQVNSSAAALKTTTASVNGHAQQLAQDAPRLQSEVRGAATKISQLDAGAAEVASGAATLDSGLGTAASGASSLHDGITQLSSGASSLASGLSDAEAQIPVLSDDQKKSNAETLASPVDVATENLHPAETYGRGLTPFFFAIALVVFGITAFLILRPVSARALASRAGNLTVALAGWLPAATCCALGGLILFVVLDVFLGLDPTLTWAMLGLVVLAAIAFTAIAHLFRTWLGGVASAVILVLLLLQLTTSAGTYPYETLPGFFRALHWFLPMSYFVDGLRVTITGGNTAHLVRDVLVLAGFLIVSLALTTLVVRRKREWTIGKLKPALSI